MVLESIINPEKEEKTPKDMVVVGFIYSTVGILVSLWIFGGAASLPQIFLTTLPLVVIVNQAFKLEEEKTKCEHRFLVKEHGPILSLFMYLFIGLLVSYAFWFTVLPPDTVRNVFDTQISTIEDITGENIYLTAFATNDGATLKAIFWNNVNVLLFCIVFSFLYGGGAIFIHTWNASVIGVAAGSVMRSTFRNYAGSFNSVFLYEYLGSFTISFSYMVHGVFEVAAYFLGAVAGGIISFAVVNHDYNTKEFKHIVFDSLDTIILAMLCLVFAAAVEVYVTPMI
ncbi:MAG: stage II sporulation protein M [Candidatus Altiarchaeota archaeon]